VVKATICPSIYPIRPFDWTIKGQQVPRVVPEEGGQPMTGSGKILTVSYGTFSCRLEGFDEPLSAIKEIAEYFRDLAADDRYFGAEAPTQDAAMLHRIAERAVKRRVEARIEDNSVILRTGEAMQTAAFAASAPAPDLSQALHRPAAAGLLAEESVAARLQRIRAAVARNARPAEDATLAEDEESSALAEDEESAAVFAAPVTRAVPAEDGSDEAVIAPQTDRSAAGPDAGPGAFSDVWEPSAPAEAATASVIMAPLALAADAGNDDVTAAPEPFDWGTPDHDAGPKGSAAAPQPSAQAEATDTDQEAPAHLMPVPEVTDTLAPLAATPHDVPPDDKPGTAGDVLVPPSVFTEQLSYGGPEDLPDSAAAEDDTFPASIAFAAPEDHEAAPDGIFEEGTPEKAAPGPLPAWGDGWLEDANSPEPTDVWDKTAFRAAEEDAHEAFAGPSGPAASDDVWPVDPDLPEPGDAAADRDAASDWLRRAEEQVLGGRAPESGGVASAASGNAAAAPAESAGESEAEPTRKAEGRTTLEDSVRDAEDVARLLRQTDTEMDDPGNRRRLAAMAHLKAAVAATEADRQSDGGGDPAGEAARLDRYREDLARVVQPRLPDGPTPAERQEPLVLVSEQRIDGTAADGAISQAVPGWISTANLAIGDIPDDSDTPAGTDNIFAVTRAFAGFAEFAAYLGARDMPDLLEAAAAYSACIEGRSQFTRPHLMRHVAAASGASDAASEDIMRSFGILLRQGKITKANRGTFAITDSSFYLAEARRMTL
jgi:hypothetical protein